MKKFLIVPTLLLLLMGKTSAQMVDTPWHKENTVNNKAANHAPIIEADVMWSKRVWRTIELREKINHPFYFPTPPINDRMSLFDVLRNAIVEKKLTAYGSPMLDDAFKMPMNEGEIAKAFTYEQTIVYDDGTNPPKDSSFQAPITSGMVTKFWLKEDWFFDKKRGVMDVRIIGICPIKELKDDKGEFKGYAPMCWIYFPEARPFLARAEAYIGNDGDRVTYDELFAKRRFSSFVHKESNVFDRYINDYQKDLGILLESEKVKEKIFVYEHDLWHF